MSFSLARWGLAWTLTFTVVCIAGVWAGDTAYNILQDSFKSSAAGVLTTMFLFESMRRLGVVEA